MLKKDTKNVSMLVEVSSSTLYAKINADRGIGIPGIFFSYDISPMKG